MVSIVNPTTTPQVYSEDGRSLGAGERRDDITLDAIGERAVAHQRLVVVKELVVAKEETQSDADKPQPRSIDKGSATARRAQGASAKMP